MDAGEFVGRYQRAWASRSSEAFRELWHENGVLEHPTLSRAISGSSVPALNRLNAATLPDLKWNLLSWASSDSLVFLEWECSACVNGTRVTWRGVDKLILRDGRIESEVVYSDTLPLWAALDPSMRRDALIDAAQLEARTEACEDK